MAEEIFGKVLGAAKNIDVEINYTTLFAKFVIIILAILLISFLIDFLLSRSILGKNYRLFVAPGVIVHELSHALFCLATGAKISKISLFDKDGGKVEHGSSKVPIIGPILISMAPLFIGAAIIYLLSKRLGITGIDLTAMDISREGVISFFRTAISNIDFSFYQNWIIVYIVLSIAVTMTPSKQDFRNIALSVVLIAVILWVLVRFAGFSFSIIQIPPIVFLMLSSILFLLILSLALSIIVFVLSNLFKK